MGRAHAGFARFRGLYTVPLVYERGADGGEEDIAVGRRKRWLATELAGLLSPEYPLLIRIAGEREGREARFTHIRWGAGGR